MTKRSFLFYTYALVDGGAERVWATLASEFAKRGHDVIFAIDYDAGQEPFALHPDVRRVTLGGNHAVSIRRLAALLRAEKPDVAFGAVAGSDLKLVAARAMARTTTRLIISYHGFLEHESGRLSWLTHITAPILTRMADRTICVSQGLRNELIARWRAKASKTICVYNPVVYPGEPATITRDTLYQRPNVIVAMGRLVPEKGFEALVRAVARMQTKDATLTILGDGPERQRLEDLVSSLGLENRVVFAGFQRNIWPHLDRAKCFAHAAHSEAFGLVVAEALARGLPVVATRSDGPSEILNTDGLGRLVPNGDIDGMALALDETLACPGAPEPRLARAADFSLEVGVAAYQRLAEDVLAARA